MLNVAFQIQKKWGWLTWDWLDQIIFAIFPNGSNFLFANIRIFKGLSPDQWRVAHINDQLISKGWCLRSRKPCFAGTCH
jgi:hypothetical protein